MLPAPTTAAALLTEWEARAQPDPAAYAAQRPALLALLIDFCALLDGPADVNVDREDLRAVLQPATALGLARAAAAGPGRAPRVTQALLAALAAQRIAGHPQAVTALLSISSPDTAELEMDELTEILQTIQQYLGPDAEMIFGHGSSPAADGTGLRLWLLVGYAAEVPVRLPQPGPPALPPPPPDATGRDFTFAAAAALVVQHQQASTPLLQRHLKLGYNRSHRLLDQLAQARIIAPGGDGRPARVLVANHTRLAQVLARLSPLPPH